MVNNVNYIRKDMPKSLFTTGIILTLVGLVLGIIGFLVDPVRALHNYLIAYLFLVSVGVGALFVVALEYITGAEWSVPLRRMIEFTAGVIPFLAVLIIPLLFSMHSMFHWTHHDVVANDKILTGKEPYLNTTFFIIRNVVFVLAWILFYFLFTKNSLKQDETGNQELTKRNIKLAAIFIPVFALSITFTSIDWMMSLEPHWFSTIFGVYYFSGTLLAALAVITLFTLKFRDHISTRLTNDHLYSLGALIFAFTNFWAYIAFSQYLLIWYADLPEETFWFVQRWENGWWIISLLLIIVHFIVPYALLLSQPAKMDPKRLKISAYWILGAHLIDLYWLIIPNITKNGYYFSWTDLVFPIFTAGIIMIAFYLRANKKNMLPVGDPKLERGLNFHL